MIIRAGSKADFLHGLVCCHLLSRFYDRRKQFHEDYALAFEAVQLCSYLDAETIELHSSNLRSARDLHYAKRMRRSEDLQPPRVPFHCFTASLQISDQHQELPGIWRKDDLLDVDQVGQNVFSVILVDLSAHFNLLVPRQADAQAKKSIRVQLKQAQMPRLQPPTQPNAKGGQFPASLTNLACCLSHITRDLTVARLAGHPEASAPSTVSTCSTLTAESAAAALGDVGCWTV